MSSATSMLEEEARNEIHNSIKLSTFSMARFGLTYNKAPTTIAYINQKTVLILSFLAIFYHIFGDIVFIFVTMSNSPHVEDVVPLLHTFGYGLLSSGKLFSVWYKKDVFRQLLKELVDIWPIPPLDEEAQAIKDKSLAALRIAHRWVFAVNMSGVWFYNLTPIVVYCYELWWLGNSNAKVGFVWKCWYPFDKHNPWSHVFVYIFEVSSGLTCVWAMIASDLLFTGMASHISLLMRLLQRRLENVTYTRDHQQNYKNIVECIKLHQRLITYCGELEGAFSMSNLENIVLSSINICCVVFVIVLLEPLVAISSKLFLISALIQVGVICWYSDDIFHSSLDVAMAAYNSEWYKLDSRCRKALIFFIKRSQKPLAFTAMKFTTINLTTYSAILSRSYSYFALLYTMYNDKNR